MTDHHGQRDQEVATGSIVLLMTPKPGSRFERMVTPLVTIDGHPVPARWDANVYPLPVGPHRIQVRMRYLWTGPPVEYDAEVGAGQSTIVHYTGPTSVLIKGSLGAHPRQSRSDRTWGIVTAAVVIAMALALVIGYLLHELGIG